MCNYLPTNDYVFKRIFGYKGNEKIVKSLVEAIVGEEFSDIVIENPILQSDDISGKTGILDVRLKADDSNVDIEMQVVKSENIQDRAMWYCSRMFADSIDKGYNYNKTKRTICVFITDFNIRTLKDNLNYHNKYMPLNCRNNEDILTNKMEIHIIELTKIDSTNTLNDNLKEWCTFLKYPERIGDSIMNENEDIKAAKEELERINSSELEKRRADERAKAIRDSLWIRDTAKEEGLAEGRAEGKAEVKIEMAKKMLSRGMSIEEIAEITGLSQEEIEKLG